MSQTVEKQRSKKKQNEMKLERQQPKVDSRGGSSVANFFRGIYDAVDSVSEPISSYLLRQNINPTVVSLVLYCFWIGSIFLILFSVYSLAPDLMSKLWNVIAPFWILIAVLVFCIFVWSQFVNAKWY
jgi:hypothetical protein